MAELAMLADKQLTVYPEEVTRQLHVIAQARESLPVIDRRSNHCATPRTLTSTNFDHDRQWFNTFNTPSHVRSGVCCDFTLEWTREVISTLYHARHPL